MIRRNIFEKKATLKNKADNEIYYAKNSVFDLIESGSVIVKIDDHKGSFEFDVRSSILHRILITKQYEKDIVSVIHRFLDCDKDVIDVGANVGLYTILFAKNIHDKQRVLAVEPIPSMLQFLQNNIVRNQCSDKIIVFKGIAIDKPGDSKINTIQGLEEYSSIGDIIHPFTNGKQSISLSIHGDTIDNLVKTNSLNPGFLKIDAEGAEYKVLTGAKDTLVKYRPIILCELSEKFLNQQGSSLQEVFSFLVNLDFSIFDAHSLEPITNLVTPEILVLPNETINKLK